MATRSCRIASFKGSKLNVPKKSPTFCIGKDKKSCFLLPVTLQPLEAPSLKASISKICTKNNFVILLGLLKKRGLERPKCACSSKVIKQKAWQDLISSLGTDMIGKPQNGSSLLPLKYTTHVKWDFLMSTEKYVSEKNILLWSYSYVHMKPLLGKWHNF